jgi:hypothetical protein
MNLVAGILLRTEDCDAVLQTLQQRLQNTLQKGWLDPEIVIAACDRLVNSLDTSVYLDAMAALGIDQVLGQAYLAEARLMFSEKNLRRRLEKELGVSYGRQQTFTPPGLTCQVSEQVVPLGVLLHIAAGNADGLPAFSVIEGLLAGNINILKLPAAEGGISVRLLQELIKIEPLLAEYIYVFDYASKDIVHIRQLVAAADAIVVWGGAEAVAALRKMADPSIRLVEWGHKISFAYVTANGMTEGQLTGLARHIAQTGQLLCSSCQGIFIDTDDRAVVDAFCRQFLPVLEAAVETCVEQLGIGIRSQLALQLYNEQLETLYNDHKIYRAAHCSLIACSDRDLKPAIQFGNAWVKALPRAELLPVLRPYKNFLQTAGLLCGEDETDELVQLLWQTGVVRVCPAERMSGTYSGAPHDGEFALRRYTRIVSCEREHNAMR